MYDLYIYKSIELNWNVPCEQICDLPLFSTIKEYIFQVFPLFDST